MQTIPYSPTRTRATWLEQALWAIVFGTALFFGALVIFVLGYQVWYAGRIFPGVRVNGIDVGGLKPAAAAERLSGQITFPQTGKILLQEKQTWLVTPNQVGLFLDPNATATSAFNIGRRGLVSGLAQQFDTWYYGMDIVPVFIYDQRLAYTFVADLAKQLDQPTLEASIELKGAEVNVRSGQTGRTVDVQATLLLLERQMQSMHDGIVPVVVRETPPVIVDVSKQAELARTILNAPLKLVMPDGHPDDGLGPWAFDTQTLASMLTFERVEKDGKTDIQIAINKEILRAFLTDLAPKLSASPKNAKFTFNDETRKIEALDPSITGRELDVDGSMQTIQEKLVQGKHKIALEFKYNDPAVTDKASGSDLGITELVHSETSYFYGSSAERVQNIKAAAARFHGVLVAPGETFSMGETMGDISLDNGFAEALIIVGNQTVKGVGGGVCQVSTTLFRTAFFAGFPVDERHAHAYRVYYYEKVYGNHISPKFAGLDATVFFPLVDFKFTNDTPYWLLMETYVDPSSSSITWKFYSTKDGRTVDWDTSGPVNIQDAPEPLYKENPDLKDGEIKQVDWAADGADVTVHRTVNKDGSIYLQDTFETHYQPWQAIYEYAPGADIPEDQQP